MGHGISCIALERCLSQPLSCSARILASQLTASVASSAAHPTQTTSRSSLRAAQAQAARTLTRQGAPGGPPLPRMPPASLPRSHPVPAAQACPPTQRMLAALVATSSACPPWFLVQVNTKVDMRLRLDAAPWLDDEVREAVRRMVRPPAGFQKPRSNLALGVRLFALHPGLNACLSSSTMLSARVTGPQRSCLSCRRLAPGVPVHHVALLAGPAGEEAHQQGGRACHHIAAHAVAGVSKSKTALAWLPCTVQGRPCASSTCPRLLPIMCGPCHHALSAASTPVRGQRWARYGRAGASLPDACFPPPLLPYQPLFMRLQLEACIEFHPAETTWRMLC